MFDRPRHQGMTALILFLYVLLAGSLLAQTSPVTGIPPLSSATTASFDTVDLANLNVHFSIPVFARAGKGIPFSYSLSYDSLAWNVVTNSQGQQQWAPLPTWGWRGVTEAATGYVTYTYSDTIQVCSNNNVEKETWTNWVYHDASGVPHPFPGTIIIYDDNGCGSGRSFSTATAADNSGYVLYLPVITSGEQIVPTTVYGPSGIKYTPPSQSQTGGASVTDPNGNSIVTAVNGSITTITDTLGTTALTINGFAPNNPLSCSPNVTYQYAAPNGQLATITASYVGYIIQTSFNVPSVQEYGPTNACLLQTITMPDGSTYGFAYEGTAGHSGELTGRLLSVTLPTGGAISWSYTNSGCYNASNCMMADGSPAWMVRTYGGNSWNYERYVRSTQGWCGSSSLQTDTTIVDPDGNYTDNYFSGLYPTSTSVYVGARSRFLDTKNYCYNGNPNPANCLCALVASTETTPITSRVVYDYPNNGTLYSETDYSYDSYGNLIGETDKDFGSGSNATLRQTKITNSATSGASNQSLCTNYNICNAPASVQITDGSTQAAYTTYSYDQGGNTHGSPTTIGQWTSGSNYLNQDYSYNSNGTVAIATDPNGTKTTFSYAGTSCNNAFPTSVTVVGQTTQYGYNCSGGVVTSVTDPNNATTSTSYTDPYFWRPASTTDPLSNVTYYNYYRVNNSGSSAVSSVGQSESVMTFNSGNSVQEILTTTDSWGRPQLTQKRQSPSSANFDTVQLMYDENSRVQWMLRPFVTNAGQASSGGLPATGYTYDTLGRVTQVDDWANLTVTYGYNLNDTEVTVSGQPSGENPKSRQFEYDGLGRLSSVCELTSATGSGCGQNNNPGTNGYKTTYTYDSLGNQVGVNQSGQTRSFAYDGLSRMTSETNPESGTKTYQYDQVGPVACNGNGWTSKGDLLVTTDARGAVTCNYYDALHRLTDIGNNSQSASNPCQRFKYDNSKGYKGSIPTGITLSNYWGRMVEAATDNCGGTGDPVLSDEWFSYDSRGQATDYWQSSTNSGGWYHVTQSYSANGNRLGLQGFLNNGSAFTQNFLYDNNEGEGRPRGLAFGSSSVWCCTAYNADGQPNQVQMVGGSTGSFETFTYDGNSGRMTQWQSYNSGVNKNQTGTLTWNGNGSLQKLVLADSYDTANGQTCTYGYDDLARLLSANCSPAWSQTFSYDAFGNLTKTGNVNYNPGYNSNNRALTSTYDSAGNTLNDGSNTYTYDAKGRPVTVGSVQILYDAFGRTVEYNTSGTYTQWVYDPQGGKLAGMTGQSLRFYLLPLAGGIKAVFNSSGLWFYRHSDWLGSSRLGLDTSGNLYSGKAFAPFGETYAEAGLADRSFTGQTQDVVRGQTGIYDFLFRQHSAAQGRWLVPDPVGLAAADPTNPQTWNRYAYVGNNPLSNVDPLGLDDEGSIFPDCWFSLGSLVQCATSSAAAHEYCVFIGLCGSNNPGGGSGGGGGGTQGGSSSPSPSAPPSMPINFPNETNGIPNGMNVNFGGPLGAILPSAVCGDMGPCPAIGNGFAPGPLVLAGAGGETICLILEPCGAGELIFGGIFVATVVGIDAYQYFAKGGPQNVADTGVLEEAQRMVAEKEAAGICDALQKMYDRSPPGPQRNKIKATQKAKGCRGH